MKIKILLTFYFGFLVSTVFSQVYDYSKIPKAIDLLKKAHISPINLGIKETKEIASIWFSKLDDSKTLFLLKDLETLVIDESILTNQSSVKELCKSVIDKYQRRLKWKDSLIIKLLGAPFNFKLSQKIAAEAKEFPLTLKEAENKISNLLIMEFYNSVLGDSMKMSKPDFIENCLKGEAKYRSTMLSVQKESVHNVILSKEEIEDNIASSLLSAICERFDPHTEYFSSEEKIRFEKSLSKDVLLFGFTLGEDEVKHPIIQAIKVGSAAWNSGELNKDDMLIKIEFINSDKQFNTSNYSVSRLNQLFQKYGDLEINLTVRKPNGETKKVYLAKQEEVVEENIVSSYILKGKHNVAYLSLPAFYTDFDANDIKGSANDIAKEIVKLKREKIEGFILDLRFNGGGSIEEAVNIAGIFVNEGPLAQIKYKDEKPSLLKDFNRGYIYDGPMIVLVNSFSASASEFLAMILQDYNRAIIVGTPTYGKATGQGILPLMDNFDLKLINQKTLDQSTDFVKTTILKIYNIDGLSYQGIGVQPEVVLPELYQKMTVGEKHMPYFLLADKLEKKVVINPMPNNMRMNVLKNKYARANFFEKVNLYSDSLANHFGSSMQFPLKMEAYYDNIIQREKFADRIDALNQIPCNAGYTISVNDIDKNIYTSTEDKKMIANKVSDIEKDWYIFEAYNIMQDMINTK